VKADSSGNSYEGLCGSLLGQTLNTLIEVPGVFFSDRPQVPGIVFRIRRRTPPLTHFVPYLSQASPNGICHVECGNGTGLLQVLPSSPVCNIPPVLPTHLSFACHRRHYKM